MSWNSILLCTHVHIAVFPVMVKPSWVREEREWDETDRRESVSLSLSLLPVSCSTPPKILLTFPLCASCNPHSTGLCRKVPILLSTSLAWLARAGWGRPEFSRNLTPAFFSFLLSPVHYVLWLLFCGLRHSKYGHMVESSSPMHAAAKWD